MENLDLENIYTPVRVDLLIERLVASNYDQNEIEFLRQGFTLGFDIGYSGPENCTSHAHNLPFKVGNCTQLWNKLIKEVKNKHVAGPFEHIPFTQFIQSTINLVPKANDQTRLIFHLSYDFGPNERSVNYHTPKEWCSVHYNDLDSAVKTCLRVKEFKLCNLRILWVTDADGTDHIYLSKTDIKSVFHLLPLNRCSWRWVVMKAMDPSSGKWKYFIDKCLPFGVSISCAHFQRFSDTLKHLIQFWTMLDTINNYLDDFLFVAATMIICNYLMREFLCMCEELGVPIAFDKTEWATLSLVFLGILLDGQHMLMIIPEDKRLKAIFILRNLLDRKKATVKELQTLCGYLNFLNKAVIPGHVFTHRMYAKFSKVADFSMLKKGRAPVEDNLLVRQYKLKPYHHVRLDAEFKLD